MKGVHHEAISFVLFAPFFLYIYMGGLLSNLLLIVLFMGVAIGALAPDVDAHDAKIFHKEYELYGKFIKYLIYLPLVFVLSKKVKGVTKRHRGLSHSLLGIICSLSLVFVYSLLIMIVWTQVYDSSVAFVDFLMYPFFIAIGFGIGSIFHLIEDSFTKMGVMWLYPKKWTLHGNVRTFEKDCEKLVGWFVLSTIVPIVIAISPESIPTENPAVELSIISGVVLCEVVVLFIVAKIKFRST